MSRTRSWKILWSLRVVQDSKKSMKCMSCTRSWKILWNLQVVQDSKKNLWSTHDIVDFLEIIHLEIHSRSIKISQQYVIFYNLRNFLSYHTLILVIFKKISYESCSTIIIYYPWWYIFQENHVPFSDTASMFDNSHTFKVKTITQLLNIMCEINTSLSILKYLWACYKSRTHVGKKILLYEMLRVRR